MDSAVVQRAVAHERVVSPRLLRVGSERWAEPESFFECIHGEALATLISEAVVPGTEEPSYSKRRMLLLFDVALRVHGGFTFSTAASLRTDCFVQAQRWFYGAMWSEQFAKFARALRQDTCAALANLLDRASLMHPGLGPIPLCAEYPRRGAHIPWNWVEEFELRKKALRAVDALRSDFLVASDGTSYRVELAAMRETLGPAFTSLFFEGLQAIATTKAKDTALRDFGTSFARFLKVYAADTSAALEPSTFKDQDAVQIMLEAYRRTHFMRFLDRVPARGKVKDLDSTQKMWGRYENYWRSLQGRGLVAWPLHGFPSGNPNLVYRQGPLHWESTISATGELVEVTQKLVTPIPLHLSDDEATELFFVRIKAEFETAHTWLDSRLARLWANYQDGKALAQLAPPTFPPIPALYDLPLAIRYFLDTHSRYVDTTKQSTLVFPLQREGRKPMGEIDVAVLSGKLGLPTKEDAISLVAYLMSTDGRFTEAALADVRIWDKDGSRINATDERERVLLVTNKHRKTGDGRHDVLLSEPARQRVLQWMEMTEPIRAEMRRQKIPGWDHLFVYLRSPLGAPSYLKRSLSLTSSFRTLCQKHGETLGHLQEILTPSRLRAQKGMLRFLENFSIQEMAEELGNEPQTTIRSYLPSAAWDFFARRWIKIFQALLIVKAAPTSPYLLQATGLSSMEDIDALLRNHTLEMPAANEGMPNQTETNPIARGPSADAIVSVSEASLRLMASLAAAVNVAVSGGRRVKPKAVYWKEFFEHLKKHIESKDFHEASIRSVLFEALSRADPGLYGGLVLE